MLDRGDIAEVLATVTPEDAPDRYIMSMASVYAAGDVEAMLPELRARAEREVWSPHGGGAIRVFRRDYLARLVLAEGRRVRNEWLAEHGAFRG